MDIFLTNTLRFRRPLLTPGVIVHYDGWMHFNGLEKFKAPFTPIIKFGFISYTVA